MPNASFGHRLPGGSTAESERIRRVQNEHQLSPHASKDAAKAARCGYHFVPRVHIDVPVNRGRNPPEHA